MSRLSGVPNYVYDSLRALGFADNEINMELTKCIPAIGNRSIVEALAEGAERSVKDVLLQWGDAMRVSDPKVYSIIPK